MNGKAHSESSPRFILYLMIKGFEGGHPRTVNRPAGSQGIQSNTINKPNRSEGERFMGGNWAVAALHELWPCCGRVVESV